MWLFNGKRKNTFYWCCEKRKLEECKGRAITIFLNELHYLQKFVDHNHAPQASSSDVAKNIFQIKQQACQTRDRPT